MNWNTDKPIVELKICVGCKREKPLFAFPGNTSKKCNVCINKNRPVGEYADGLMRSLNLQDYDY